MKTALLRLAVLLVPALEAHVQQGVVAATEPAAIVKLAEDGQAHEIAVQVSVNELPYDEYWQKSFDAIFAFADANSDGMLNDKEILLVPSARAIRLSLGSGFTPPVASLQALRDVVPGDSPMCSKEQLRNYYQRHGAGQILIGYGRLSNTGAITEALLRALDEDRDGNLSEGELFKAETALRRLDTNDDELIGVGELVPSATYPGNWASNLLQPSTSIDLSVAADRSFMLSRLPVGAPPASNASENSGPRGSQPPETAAPINRTTWQIAISGQLRAAELQVNMKARCESWSVPGPLNDLHAELRKDLSEAMATSRDDTAEAGARNRRPSADWLTAAVDRDQDGKASQPEVDQWLALQKQLIQGQLLVSVYHGGGLFEVLDTNHDAGLSVRELRSAWRNLQSASGTSAGHVNLNRLPSVLLFVVSQGYPNSLARTKSSDVEWFRRMDRNADGDVSRREFTGSMEAFSKLDKDRDSLISPSEAAEVR